MSKPYDFRAESWSTRVASGRIIISHGGPYGSPRATVFLYAGEPSDFEVATAKFIADAPILLAEAEAEIGRLKARLATAEQAVGLLRSTNGRLGAELKAAERQGDELAEAGWDESTYAASIEWSATERNTREWLEGLEEKIEAFQAVVQRHFGDRFKGMKTAGPDRLKACQEGRDHA